MSLYFLTINASISPLGGSICLENNSAPTDRGGAGHIDTLNNILILSLKYILMPYLNLIA